MEDLDRAGDASLQLGESGFVVVEDDGAEVQDSHADGFRGIGDGLDLVRRLGVGCQSVVVGSSISRA